ncbi:MAG: VOC family protein [Elusimicrobiaceae bacterium]|nr:VOC family protein [Elusimicrobiaceae bacterium]
MQFKFDHYNFNVLDFERSMAFYAKTLGLKEMKRREAADGSFTLGDLGDGQPQFRLELTRLKNRTEKYNPGEGEFHLAVRVDDFEAAKKLHRKMNCICHENETMGICFIKDPDGYWLEIVPAR